MYIHTVYTVYGCAILLYTYSELMLLLTLYSELMLLLTVLKATTVLALYIVWPQLRVETILSGLFTALVYCSTESCQEQKILIVSFASNCKLASGHRAKQKLSFSRPED